MLKISNNLLRGKRVEHVDTSKKSRGTNTKKFIVVHYTAGTSYKSDVRVLSSAKAQVSCHLVVGPSGKITQVGDFDDVLWHAGKSKWRGLHGLNRHSIGIEVTCPGPVEYVGKDSSNRRIFKTWSGHKLVEGVSPWGFVKKQHRNGGRTKWWATFTLKQNEVLAELIPLIVDMYGVTEVVGHDDIAPTRKQDPGPSMSRSLWSLIEGRNEDGQTIESSAVGSINNRAYIVTTPDNSNLNTRDAPNGKIIGSLPNGTPVDHIGVKDKWIKVKSPAGYKGWVYGKYLKRV
ncbi:MAG: hypothetical protein COA52_00440 [Hyphomicrobiales bacterium]|nr:MAG: hypothetical protein COA52_00440 [Hyphomicrobiales bacterium]